MHLSGRNIHLVDQLLVQRIGIALLFVRLDGIEFELGENHDILKAQPLVFMPPHQFPIDADGRFPGGQRQHAVFSRRRFGLDRGRDFVRHTHRSLFRRRRNVGGNALEPGDDLHRFGPCFQSSFGLKLVIGTHNGFIVLMFR